METSIALLKPLTSSRILKLMVVLVATATSVAWLGGRAWAANDVCWELIQNSQLGGKHRVLISSKAVKVESTVNRYAVVAKAPKWNVTAYNRWSKLSYETKLESFRGQLAAGTGTMGGYLESLPVGRGRRLVENIVGQQCTRIQMINPSPNKAKKRVLSSVFFNQDDIREANYWLWNREGLPKAAGLIMCRVYRIPEMNAVPLRLITETIDHDKERALDTVRIRMVPYQEFEYNVPPCRKVASELEVVNDRNRKRNVKNLIDSWDNWDKIIDTEKH